MIAALVLLSVAVVALASALVAQAGQSAKERGLLTDEFAAERAHLIDVIVARHAGDLRALRNVDVDLARASVEASPEVLAYEVSRARDLEAMGYDPKDVPRVPDGLDG